MAELEYTEVRIPRTDWVCRIWDGGCTFRRVDRGGHIVVTNTYVNAGLVSVDEYLYPKIPALAANVRKVAQSHGSFDIRKIPLKHLPFIRHDKG
jgi:hypothetical protein